MKAFIITICILISFNSFAQTPKVPKFDYGNEKSHGHYLNTRGFKMYYEIYGKGEPLLIIHGNGGSINNFSAQIPYFSKKYQVILADNRAQGKSADSNDSLSYEMMTDDLNALLDSLHKDSCYVIGWSDGGIEGLLLAIRHPKKVKMLAVTGANLQPDPILSTDPWVVENELHTIDSLKRLPVTAATKQLLKLHTLLVVAPHISHDALHTITAPTLVIAGDHDVIMPRHTLEIAENIEKSNLWILPNSGHSTPIRYADKFNTTVHSFFVTPYVKIDKSAKFY